MPAWGRPSGTFSRHWQELTLFLRQPGAPLDNTLTERTLKKAILHRKNALFFRTTNGAHVGDLFMSLIHTCELAGANAFDYLTQLQQHADAMRETPVSLDALELSRDSGEARTRPRLTRNTRGAPPALAPRSVAERTHSLLGGRHVPELSLVEYRGCGFSQDDMPSLVLLSASSRPVSRRWASSSSVASRLVRRGDVGTWWTAGVILSVTAAAAFDGAFGEPVFVANSLNRGAALSLAIVGVLLV